MTSIAAMHSSVQENPPQGSKFANGIPIVGTLKTSEAGAAQDHGDEAAMRQRLEEWRSRAGNLAGGFTQMPDAVRQDSSLGTSAKMVYEHLLSYMRQKEWCWPGQQRIANELGISRRTVIRACKELDGRGYITKWRRGLGRTNYYFANPLSFVASTGIALTQLCLQTSKELVAGSPVANLYGITFYANDPLYIQQCQNVTSANDKTAQPEMPESHTKHTKSESHSDLKNTVTKSNPDPERGGARTIGSIDTMNEERSPTTTTIPNKAERPVHQAAQAPAEVQQEQGQDQQRPQASPTGARAGGEAQQQALPLEETQAQPERLKRPIPEFIVEAITRITIEAGDWQRSLAGNITRAAKNYFMAYDYLPGFAVLAQYYFEDWIKDAEQQAYACPVQDVRVKGPQGANYMPLFWDALEGKFHYDEEEKRLLRSNELLYEQRYEE